MIRVRRADSDLPFMRAYEIEFASTPTEPAAERIARARRDTAVRRVERAVGTGDAWSFIEAADRAWDAGDRSWAVEHQSPG